MSEKMHPLLLRVLPPLVVGLVIALAAAPPAGRADLAARPGDAVDWVRWPTQREEDKRAKTKFLADVVCRIPEKDGDHFHDKDPVVWAHEGTHAVHAALRTAHGVPGFYVGNGWAALVRAPKLTLRQVAEAVPPELRGDRYKNYLIDQRKEWDADPLYVFDEWTAYVNGARAGLELDAEGELTDVMAAPLEFSAYAFAVVMAAQKYDPGWLRDRQVGEFLAFELRRSCSVYKAGLRMPRYRWGTSALEATLKGNRDLSAVLKDLYGGRLTYESLLPGR